MPTEFASALAIFFVGQLFNTLISGTIAKTELKHLREALDRLENKFSEAHEALMTVVHDHEARLAVMEDRGDRRRRS
jgi:hypothetical protein